MTGSETDVLMNVEFRGVDAVDDAGLCINMLLLGFENTVDTGLLRTPLPEVALPCSRNSAARLAMRSWTKILMGSINGLRRNQSHCIIDHAR